MGSFGIHYGAADGQPLCHKLWGQVDRQDQ